MCVLKHFILLPSYLGDQPQNFESLLACVLCGEQFDKAGPHPELLHYWSHC
jgi:hypothetical protein